MPIEVKDNSNLVLEALRKLTKTRVLVGIPSDAEQPHLGDSPGQNIRQDAGKAGKRELTNAELAYIHTHGAPEVNLPARAFLEPGVKRVEEQIKGRFQDAAKAGLRGDNAVVDANFDAVGLLVQSAARAVIAEGIPPPLKPSTVAARMHRTKASSYKRKAAANAQRDFNATFAGSMEGSPTTPLIDSAQLLHAISFVKRGT